MKIPDPTTPEGIAAATTYIVPGLIAFWTRSHFVHRTEGKIADFAIVYVIFSLVWLSATSTLVETFKLTGAFWLPMLRDYIGPALAGVLLGILAWHKPLYRLAGLLRLPVRDPVPTAWETAAGQYRDRCVVVVLKDSRKIYGYIGKGSIYSDMIKHPDLLIEDIWEHDADGDLMPVDDTSMLIMAGEISTATFVPPFYKEKLNEETNARQLSAIGVIKTLVGKLSRKSYADPVGKPGKCSGWLSSHDE